MQKFVWCCFPDYKSRCLSSRSGGTPRSRSAPATARAAPSSPGVSRENSCCSTTRPSTVTRSRWMATQSRPAARLDDLLNFLPARLSGVLMCLAAPLAGQDGRNAWRIFRRDRRRHKSPNSAHTEAAAAGALHLRLNGPNWYFGKLVDKPSIGDDDRPVEAEDIRRANRLMFATAGLSLLLFDLLPLALLLL